MLWMALWLPLSEYIYLLGSVLCSVLVSKILFHGKLSLPYQIKNRKGGFGIRCYHACQLSSSALEGGIPFYFDGGNVRMRDAGVYVRENNWDSAFELWKQIYDKGKGRQKCVQPLI